MKKILLIEDNTEILDNTAEILELAGYKVFKAENGKLGVEEAVKEKPDLIICDVMMPELDGYGVLHMLQKKPETQNIPFIFLTAKAERSELRKGMDAGADDYITKPFNATDLLNSIESRFKKIDLLKREMSPQTNKFSETESAENSKDIIREFTEGRNIFKFKRKQIIYTEGNHPTQLYYIRKGKVKTFKRNDEGKELVMSLYGEGEFLGYTAMLEGSPYKASAEAIEDTEIAIIPREDFEELINGNRNMLHKFIKLLAKNIAEKEEHLLGLAYNSLRKKVAEALIILKKKYDSAKTEHFQIDITRENLAAIAGTATESFIRTLSDFKNEHLIDIKNGGIVILNEEKLKNMVN